MVYPRQGSYIEYIVDNSSNKGGLKRMRSLLVGVGAAGNKAVMTAIEQGSVKEENTIMINSTSKDFPQGYSGKTIILSPDDTGCGKEQAIAKGYAISAIKAGKFNIEGIESYSMVIICTSVEGGTGSGSTPLIAEFFSDFLKKNTHVIAFTGFEEDVRGLSNTVEFFKSLSQKLIIQTIRNKAFLRKANNNKFKAEELANLEMCKRIEILTAKNFIPSSQNIDDTDIMKVSNTAGYMTIEHRFIEKPLADQDEFNHVVKKMIYESASIKSNDPGASRIGVILNVDPMSEDAIDFTFATILEAYGMPFEKFMQKQWDGKKEYIALIVSGMQMPIDEIKAVYDRYKEESERVNKNADMFFAETKDLGMSEEDTMFNMIRPVERNQGSIDDFLSKFEN